MKTGSGIYFDELPLIENVIARIKTNTGIDVQVSFLSKTYLELIHPFQNEPESIVELTIVPKETIEDPVLNKYGAKCQITVTFFSTTGWTYLSGAVAAVLQDMGGEIEFDSTYKLPNWSRMKWQGKDWWQTISK